MVGKIAVTQKEEEAAIAAEAHLAQSVVITVYGEVTLPLLTIEPPSDSSVDMSDRSDRGSLKKTTSL